MKRNPWLSSIVMMLCLIVTSCFNTPSSTDNPSENLNDEPTSEQITNQPSESETHSIEQPTSESISSEINNSEPPSVTSEEPSEPIVEPEFELTSVGYNEGMYLTWQDSEINLTSVEYKLIEENKWTKIDEQLIRKLDNELLRADIIGLNKGNYEVKVNNSKGQSVIQEVNVKETDRSGYAHFNVNEEIGAYNNDGTLKEKAIVVYVNEENKNSVKATIANKQYTGLASIIKAQSKSNVPLNIRIIGTIGTSTWNPIIYEGDPYSLGGIKDKDGNVIKENLNQEDIISKGVNTLDTSMYSTLNGLRNQLKYSNGEYDSCWNTLEVSEANNITIEGIGSDATIMNWGFTFKKCSSLEIRNLTFTNNPEDACGIEGDTSNPTTYSRFFIHNNVFNKGYNSWDVTAEQDKGSGDGSTDFKGISNVTSSYNVFNKCKKTGLIGGGDSNLTMNVTFHHNYYNQVGSRLPLGRQANMHIYNNYYYKCGTAQDIRTNAFVFSECNYFEETKNPQKVNSAVIKSYNDYFVGCGESKATIVSSRTKTLTGSCKPDGKTNYTNFDIDSSKFYYDEENKQSDVRLLTSAKQAKEDCLMYAGVVKEDGAYPTLND